MTDIVNSHLQKTCETYNIGSHTFQRVRPCLVCKDGFSLSIQAGEHLYSTPRIDGASHYTHVEVGYPSARPPESWRQYAEDGWGENVFRGFWLSLGRLYRALRYGHDFTKRMAVSQLFRDRATTTIYPYIPVGLVVDCINLHGDIKEQVTTSVVANDSAEK